jgi:Zn finger protein HypA/HybF involved in hydrogenase expression
MERKTLKIYMNISWIVGIVPLWVFIILLLMDNPIGGAFGIFAAIWIVGFGSLTLYLDRKMKEQTAMMKFYCKKCDEYSTMPKDNPICLKCGLRMYPVRYCPKCKNTEPMLEEYWQCNKCGAKMEDIKEGR